MNDGANTKLLKKNWLNFVHFVLCPRVRQMESRARVEYELQSQTEKEKEMRKFL